MDDNKVDAWMPLWIGAYLADTMMLNTQQHGAYLLLLIAYWRNGGPLEDDDEELATTVRATPTEWKKLRPKVARFFDVGDGLWTHGRAEKELAAAGGRRAAAVAKAKQAAEMRWSKARGNAASNAPSMPGALPEQCPTPSPSPIPSECGANAPPGARAAKDGYSYDFETAWREYPSRTGHSKAEAWRAWKARLAAGTTVALMLEGTRRYAAYCEACRTEPRFVKHAVTFYGPDQHFLSDWTPPGEGRLSAVNTGSFTPSIHERRAATLAGLTSTGEPNEQRTVDAPSRFVG